MAENWYTWSRVGGLLKICGIFLNFENLRNHGNAKLATGLIVSPPPTAVGGILIFQIPPFTRGQRFWNLWGGFSSVGGGVKFPGGGQRFQFVRLTQANFPLVRKTVFKNFRLRRAIFPLFMIQKLVNCTISRQYFNLLCKLCSLLTHKYT